MNLRAAVTGVMAWGGLLLGSAHGDQLIIQRSQGFYQLTLKGAPTSDYRFEFTSDLESGWTPLGIATTDSAGALLTQDAAAGVARRFYRAVLLPALVGTGTATAVDDNTIDLILGGSDPSNSGASLQVIISGIPADGWVLYQWDGTPITANGTLVTDPQGRVVMRHDSNTNGVPLTVGYELRRSTTGALSPQNIIEIGARYTAPRRFSVPESGEVYAATLLRLTCDEPGVTNGGAPYTIRINIPTTRGTLYQVMDDDHTPGDPIYSTLTNVTNQHGYVLYEPPPYQWGAGFETFTIVATDRYGHDVDGQISIAIDITQVYQHPYGAAQTFSGENDFYGFTIIPSAHGYDTGPIYIYFTSLPEKGKLYEGELDAPDPNKLVTTGKAYNPGNFTFFTDHLYSDYGSPYADLSYYVLDSQSGYTSPTYNCPINVIYVNTPPTPTTPTDYSVAANSQSGLPITFTDTDPDGDLPAIYLTSLPTLGSLFYHGININQLVANGQASLPIEVDEDDVNTVTYYPGGASGHDSFKYYMRDEYDAAPEVTINITITPPDSPSFSGQTAVTVTRNSGGTVTQAGVIDKLVIADDSLTSTANMSLTFATANGAQAKYAISNPQNVTVSHPDTASVKLVGTLSAINAVIASSHITYTPTSRPSPNLTATASDLGNNGSGQALSTSLTLTANDVTQ